MGCTSPVEGHPDRNGPRQKLIWSATTWDLPSVPVGKRSRSACCSPSDPELIVGGLLIEEA